ncbi:hypothetical protein QQZ08_003637 [Neonectria magnoliae]|uniref:Prostacyclin synthase n=1 Tax=Neonectria magnoliae TaxID=2732573 RepID=A0ABR1I894_9HYPO
MPICTLPMLNGKLYVINSPSLIQSALRNNDISFDPFLTEFSKGMFGQDDRQIAIVDRVMKEVLDIVHSTLLGEPLHKLNTTTLKLLMKPLNFMQPNASVQVPNAFLWIRDNTTEAITTALFGEKNPITAEHVHHLWTFDESATLLAIGVAPNLIAPKSVAARNELNRLLLPYYEAENYLRPDVSEVIRSRAVVLRREGFSALDLAIQELLLPWVGTTNTIPTLFWLFAELFSRPDYLERVKAEIEATTTMTSGQGRRTAVIDVRKLEKHCPVLHACYQETLRVYIHSVGNRRVMNDTTIQDSEGRKYLMKKGINVQWPPMVTHFLDSVWGEDAAIFNPERFLNVTAQDERIRRGAMLPFGGGRHLCPGRKFAFTEILGFVGVVALGFEVQGLALPDSEDQALGSAPRRPIWGKSAEGFTLRRRAGWEDVAWTFE